MASSNKITDLSGNNTTKVETKVDTNSFQKDNYFNSSNLLLTGAFIVAYFLLYGLLGTFYDGSDPTHPSTKAGIVDWIILVLLIGTGFLYYFSLPPSRQETYWDDMLASLKGYLNNAYSIVEVVIFIVAMYTGIYLVGIPMTPDSKPWTVSFLESKAYILLFILLFIQFFKYILKIDIIGVIFGTVQLPSAPAVVIDTSGSVVTSADAAKQKEKNEVYNISNNFYTYEDAKSVCKAMGSRLATYDEIEDAYNNGAEWSTYGWSEGQHAYFPTQKETWNKLQKEKGHENDLGRPGVNGGYFSNPNVRFGVNCYGVKPPMTDSDKALMDAKKDRVYPKTPEDQLLDAKVEFWKANKDKYMVVSGYNNNAWSRY
jgi:hypothetical protein